MYSSYDKRTSCTAVMCGKKQRNKKVDDFHRRRVHASLLLLLLLFLCVCVLLVHYHSEVFKAHLEPFWSK